MQLRNRLFVLCILIVSSSWLIGCGAPSVPMPAPTTPAATKTFTPTTPTSAPTSTPTFAPTLTNTLAPTFTSTPTNTPTPTRAPLPTSTPPPGWKKLESAQVELWVPGSFVGGDPLKDRDPIIKSLRALGPEYAGYIKAIDQNPSPFAIYAIDSAIGSTGFITSISVTVNQIVSTGTVDTYQGGVSQQLPAQYDVLDRRLVLLNYYQAERMVTDSPVQSIHMRQLVYTIKSTNTAWIIAFSTVEGEWLTRLPAFEQSIQTLRLKP